jgi:hypothetical protein
MNIPMRGMIVQVHVTHAAIQGGGGFKARHIATGRRSSRGGVIDASGEILEVFAHLLEREA